LAPAKRRLRSMRRAHDPLSMEPTTAHAVAVDALERTSLQRFFDSANACTARVRRLETVVHSPGTAHRCAILERTSYSLVKERALSREQKREP